MRFNAAFLALTLLPGLSLATQAHHGPRLLQRRQFTNSSSIASSATTTTAPQPTASVDLSDAALDNAQLTTVNGQTAVLFSPPANGQASLAVSVAAPNIGPDTASITATLTIQVNPSTGTKNRKRQDDTTDCNLVVTLGGQTVYNEPIVSAGGAAQGITTGSIAATSNTDLSVTEQCGANPVTLAVYNVALAAGSAPPDPNPPVSSPTRPITTPTPTGTDTVSFTTPTGSATTPITSLPSPTGTTTPNPTATSTPGFPSTAGNFQFYGCVGSSQNFPSFNLVASSATMDLETCAGLCGGSTFAGIYSNQCYCGSQVDGTSAAKVSNAQCNVPCPGNANEFCGGNLLLAKRQAVPAGILLTVYINVDIVPVTTTATVTALTTTTAANGSPTTVLATVTTTYCPLCAAASAVPCVGGYCGAAWAFVEYAGSDCSGEIVYVVQQCSCAGGWAYQPLLCTGNVCVGLVVYKPVQCGVNTTCNGVQVFTPTTCSTCQGGVIFTQQVVSGCTGTNCAVTGGSSSLTVTTGSCTGANCGVVSGSSSSSSTVVTCTGANCGSTSGKVNTTVVTTTGSCNGKACVYTAGSSRVAASSLLGLAATFLMALF